jgi:group I intron endonuclease
MPSFDIYCIKNKVNDKLYIGQTVKGFQDRWVDHLSFARTYARKSKLYNAMRKYGIENFYVEKLCSVNDLDELNELEEFLISELKTAVYGYNIRQGGNNTEVAESTRRLLSSANKGKKLSDETKQKIGAASKKHYLEGKLTGLVFKVKGYKHSDEVKLKIGKAHKGKKLSAEHRAIATNNLLSVDRHSDEYKKARYDGFMKARAVSVDQFTLDGLFIKTWPSIKEAAETTGVCYGTIRANMVGRRRTGKGSIWKRAEKSCE